MKLSVLLLLLLSPASAYKPARMCQPDVNKEYYCSCLLQHPKEEFCESPTAPLPSCCLATEKKSKVHMCGCCRSVYGSKRNINADERGSYVHMPVVEYAQ